MIDDGAPLRAEDLAEALDVAAEQFGIDPAKLAAVSDDIRWLVGVRRVDAAQWVRFVFIGDRTRVYPRLEGAREIGPPTVVAWPHSLRSRNIDPDPSGADTPRMRAVFDALDRATAQP